MRSRRLRTVATVCTSGAVLSLVVGAAVGCASAEVPPAAGAFVELEPVTEVDAPTTSTTTPAPVETSAPTTTVESTDPPRVTAPPDVALGTVAVVGDSLSLSAADAVEAELLRIGVDRVVVDAVQSRRMVAGSADLPSGRSAIRKILGDDEPDLWVVALGTNDVGAGSDAAAFAADVESVLESIPDAAPVVWVDVWVRDRRAETVQANLALREVLDRRAAPSGVALWYSAAAAPGNVISDGVHLTDAGRERFASEIGAAVVSLVLGPG